jgi:CRP-like cAMP-binding protein
MDEWTSNRKLLAIKGLALFSNLSDEEAMAVSEKVRSRSFRERDTIISQGDRGGIVYFIVEGLIRIYLITSEGREKTLSLQGPGTILGEASTPGKTRSAYAEAITDSKLLEISEVDFIGLLKKEANIGLNIVLGLSERLRRSDALIEESLSLSLKDRLFLVLLRLSEQLSSTEITISHEELARIVGAGRSRVTEALNLLKGEGLISIGRRVIEVHDVK